MTEENIKSIKDIPAVELSGTIENEAGDSIEVKFSPGYRKATMKVQDEFIAADDAYNKSIRELDNDYKDLLVEGYELKSPQEKQALLLNRTEAQIVRSEEKLNKYRKMEKGFIIAQFKIIIEQKQLITDDKIAFANTEFWNEQDLIGMREAVKFFRGFAGF